MFSLINWSSHYFWLFRLWSAGQKDKKNRKKKKKAHTPRLLTFASQICCWFFLTMFQFAAYPLVLGRKEVSSWFSKLSLKTDKHQEHQKWIHETATQVEGYNLFFMALSHYIGSAVTQNLILTYLSLRKPFRCFKSRSCIKKPCKCDADVIY